MAGNTSYVIPINIPQMIQLGLGFVASFQGKTATNANLTECAISLFNASNSGKSIILYSIRLNSQTSASSTTVRVTTTDPTGTTGYTGTCTASNQILGGTVPSSVVSLCATADGPTASVTPVGTTIDTVGTTGNASTEILSNGSYYLLPAGVAKGIAIFEFVSTAGNAYGATLRWIEY